MKNFKIKEHNPLQNISELTWFTKLAKDLGVKKYLEIGTDQGCTMFAVLANSPKGSLGVSIDLNTNSFLPTYEELKSLGYEVKVLGGDSKDPDIIELAKSLGPYDLVLIDGDHTYLGVKTDWENFGGLAPVIVIHDTAPGSSQPDVTKFWNELKLEHAFIEIADVKSQLGYGVILRAPWIREDQGQTEEEDVA